MRRKQAVGSGAARPPATAPAPRRRWLVAGLVSAVVLAGAWTARLALTGMAAQALLRLAGVSDVRFAVTQVSPWQVVFQGVTGQVRTQVFSAQRVSFSREHWWTPSLGSVRVDQAWLPLTIDGSDTNPWSWATYQNGTVSLSPLHFPIRAISLDGQVVVRAAVLPEQAVTVKVDAQLTPGTIWEVRASAAGRGLGAQANARFDPGTQALVFQLPDVSLDLNFWQDFVQRLVLLPGGAVQLGGQLTGSAQGKWSGKAFTASGAVRIRDGRLSQRERGLTAEGVDVDLTFKDFDQFVTEPGRLRLRKLQVGQLVLGGCEADFAFAGANKIIVSRAELQALGGRVTAEPFRYYLDQRELDVVLLVDNISMAEVMALTKDLPAQVSGRLDGRLPIHLDAGGLQLGTGWLALKPGVHAQIQFNAAGLLTSGVAPNNPRYAILHKIESGLLQLKVGELRLEIRPPNAPAGRSAQLHMEGEPVDPALKAPVTLDLNVNGPLEKLIDLGLDSRTRIGAKPD